MLVGAVHHVSSVDEAVAGPFHADLHLVVSQNDLSSVDTNAPQINFRCFLQTQSEADFAHSPKLFPQQRLVPAVDADGREVQLVFGLEDQRLGADLQDGRLLQRSGDGEQSQLRGDQRAILRHPVLTVEELQAAAEVQGLKMNGKSSD